MTLAPPSIVEELSVCSTFVRLKNQIRGSLVEILIDGTPDPVGGGIADWADQWFPLKAGVALKPGQTVRARQSFGGEVSFPSSDDVHVQDRAATRPQFIAPVVACSSIASLGSFTPGSTATVVASDGKHLGSQLAAGSRVVVHLSRSIVLGEVLFASTDACGAGPAPAVHSPPAEPMRKTPAGRLLTPELSGEVRECMRVLHFANTQVGATLFLDRDSGSLAWEVTDSELYGRVDPPLVGDEKLIFWQEAPIDRCEAQPSERATRKVAKGPPPAPWISSPICPGTPKITVGGLVPSATVEVLAGGVEVRRFDAAEETAEVDLAGVNVAPGDQLTVRQGLCDVFGPASSVPSVVMQPEESVQPTLPQHLVSCAGVVRVGGVVEGSYVQVFSKRLKGRIGHAMAYGDYVDVFVTPTLLEPAAGGIKDRVLVTVAGCANGHADGQVDDAPDIPPISIDVPSDGDRSVHVTDLVAGCLIDVAVDGTTRGEVWSGGTEIRVPVVDPLREGQIVVATARLCSQLRRSDAVSVKPPFKVDWSLPTYYGLELVPSDPLALVPHGHMAGRVTAALWIDPAFADDIWVGTEESGIWRVSPGVPTVSGSYDWTMPLVTSLVLGPRSKGHIYCGTQSGIMEADGGAPGGSFKFQRVNGVPGFISPFVGATPVPGGNVNQMVALRSHNLLVAATNSGVWWSPVPATIGIGYTWSSDPLVNSGNFTSVCEGISESIVAYRSAAGGSGVFVGTWTPAGLKWTETTPGLGAPADPRLSTVAANMLNGKLASCAGDRSRVYLVVSDGRDANWLAVLRSDQGGKKWSIPYVDPDLKKFRPADPKQLQQPDPNMYAMGLYADRLLVVAAHPQKADIVLIAGQRDGPLGSIDGGANWDSNRWRSFYGDDPWTFHPDAMCMEFSPYDPSGNTLVVGSDGGVFISRDLGATWDSSGNERFPTLMFDQQNQSVSPALSASSQYPGLLVGGTQDNGSVYLPDDNKPWRSIIGGDGYRALFITPDVVFMGSNDPVAFKWARWSGAAFTDAVELAPPGYPDASKFRPFLSRVEYPKYRDPMGNALMVAVAGDALVNDVFGLFDRGAATDPPANRFYWKSLATLTKSATALDSLDGKRVLIGTADTTIRMVYSADGTVVTHSLPADLPAKGIRWMRWATGGLAFCVVDDTLLRTTNLGTWTAIDGPAASSDIEVIEVDRAWDPVGLFLGGSDGVWLSRDLGATWRETTGLPRRPHVNHMEVVEWPPNDRVIHAATWNWSAWRAKLK